MHVDLVVGARPNYVKAAALHRAWRARRDLPDLRLVATGQHHDPRLGEEFGVALGLPSAHVRLAVPPDTAPAAQIGEVMIRYDRVLASSPRPRAVIVIGDVSSTIAAALAAAKRDLPVVHLEAGLRSFEADLPEELNRVLVGRIARVHLASEPSAVDNLRREGVPAERIHLVGSTSVDSLRHALSTTSSTSSTADVIATLHRPANVDDPARLRCIVDALVAIGSHARVTVALHPRTHARLAQARWLDTLAAHTTVCEPLAYDALVGALRGARLVVTDSGGLQEEASALGVPCLTLRDATERPLTLTHGTNELVGARLSVLGDVARERLSRARASAPSVAWWDGLASERAAHALVDAIASFV